MIDKSKLPAGCDCDTAYQILHGEQESPGSFRGRYQRKQLTDEEHARCTGATSPEDAFAKLYPNHVSLHAFREKWATEAAPEPQADADEGQSEATTDDE